MSSATFSAGAFGPGKRRALSRRLGPAPVKTAVAGFTPAVALPAFPERPVEETQGGNKPLLLAAVVLALHAGFIYYLKHRPAEPVVQAVAAPIVVDLAPPPVVEPPKPLPQKKLAPPLPPETPHLNLPPPPPVTSAPPVESPTAPVVQAPPPAPITPPPPVAVPEPVTPATGYAGYLNNPQPAYPQFAIDQGWEGRVLLGVHVLASGHPDHVDVKHGSGHKLLDELAAKTVLQRWAFAPAKRGQTAVDGWVDVPIDFKLSN